jgi:hypothetical protein
MISIVCPYCGKSAKKRPSDVNRAKRTGLKIYCSLRCSALGRRGGKTKAQKKEEKRLYDIEYRTKNLDEIRAKKKEYFKRTYDPVKAAKDRKKTMARHVEYCRQPWYKAWKKEYDKRYRASEYGEYADVFLLVQTLDREIQERMSNEEIHSKNETYNKKQHRSREAGQAEKRGRPRFRDRRANH